MAYKSDIEIAREAKKQQIQDVGAKLGIPSADLLPYGHDKAKVSAEFIKAQRGKKDGKLILVTAINPTPAGEGKTTTTVGLGDGLNAIGKKAAICIREASLGPCFGMKGGAAGGGYAQVVPMEEMNLHFTGDFHAITSAHNLLSAMIDNHIYWGNELGIDERRVVWRRVMDMNDRALRDIVTSLGGVSNGFPRQTGFDITVASEVMAILCLALDLEDLEKRLGDIIVAYRRDKTPIYCRDIKADGAMTVLLKDAMQPNLVQTLENNPAFVHGGPFANIAHGCNSVVATTTALKLADYVVTEAGFGADLGAEKFMNIKCRKAGLAPSAVVLVATVRAMKMNGGVAKADLGTENVKAVTAGCPNLGRHIANLKSFGVPVVVAINHFVTDTDAEVQAIKDYVKGHGSEAILCKHWAQGSEGIKELATRVAKIADGDSANFSPLYPDEMSLFEKVETIAKRIYHADEVLADKSIRDQLKTWEAQGYGHLPICMAKTQYSFTTDPNRRGAPTGHSVPVREVRLSAGAGFVVVICGEIMTMPGLPRVPSAESIMLNVLGQFDGLFYAGGGARVIDPRAPACLRREYFQNKDGGDMGAQVIDGKAFAAVVRGKVAAHVARLKSEHGITPGLAVVLVGEDPASKVYVRNKGEQTVEVGMNSIEHKLPADVSEAELFALVDRLNADPDVHGILVQFPVPKHLSEETIVARISPEKDVDGLHVVNAGLLASGGKAMVSCTPLGCLMLLRDQLGSLSGMNAVVVGRSNLVGKPMAQLLLRDSCTVTIAHSRTRDIEAVCRGADILVAAVGRPEMVKGSWVKPGATVIDVGINRIAAPERGEGKFRLVGDVDYASAAEVAGAITPVPGGVGPMTIACLLANTVTACCRANGLAEPEGLTA